MASLGELLLKLLAKNDSPDPNEAAVAAMKAFDENASTSGGMPVSPFGNQPTPESPPTPPPVNGPLPPTGLMPPDITNPPPPEPDPNLVPPPETPPPLAPPAAPEPPPPVAAAQAPVAEAYKSPPDLISMYDKLMQKSRNAAAMDRGMTLIAAGLAQDQNKQALIHMAAGAGGGGTGAPSMTDLINLQKMQTEQQQHAERQAQLPALMQKYGLDAATVQYLDSTDQLDETISALANPDTQVVESFDGTKKLINSKNGETIKELSGAKPRATEFVEMGDKSKILVYSDDKTRVDNGEKLTNVSAPAPETEVVHSDADGSNVLIEKATGKQLGIVTPGKTPEGDILERADGSKALINKTDGKVIRELSGAKEINADDKDTLARINAQRKANGMKDMTVEEFAKMTKGGVNVYTGDNGVKYPEPQKDFDYDRNPDGTVKVYPEGKNADGSPSPAGPHLHIVPGSAAEQEAIKNKQAIDKAKIEAGSGAAAAAKTDTSKGVKSNIVVQSIDDSLAMLKANEGNPIGVTGAGANLSLLPWNTDARTMSDQLNVIKNNIAIDQLQAMRAESKSGGALGSVTEGEERLLKSVLGSLDQYGDDKVLARDLRRLKAGIDLVVNGVYDPEHPTTNPVTGEVVPYRAPTDNEVAAALQAARDPPVGEEVTTRPGSKVKRIQ